jgi:hypothetical protein
MADVVEDEEVGDWREYTDVDTGKSYYYNASTDETKFLPGRPAKDRN